MLSAGGAEMAATCRAIPPARMRPTASLTVTARNCHAAAAKAAHATTTSGTRATCHGLRPGWTRTKVTPPSRARQPSSAASLASGRRSAESGAQKSANRLDGPSPETRAGVVSVPLTVEVVLMSRRVPPPPPPRPSSSASRKRTLIPARVAGGLVRTPRGAQRDEPAAVHRPGLRCREPGGGGELVDLVRADVRPREPGADLARRPQPDLLQPQRGARRLDLHQGLAQRAEELADPAQQRDRVTADPDVPVGQQDGFPPAAAGHLAEDIAHQRERPRRPGHVDRVGGDVDAKGGNAALGQRPGQASGP